MRPSNADISKSVAAKVLSEVFSTLTALGYELTTDHMRLLMDRVDARLQRDTQVKAGSGKEART